MSELRMETVGPRQLVQGSFSDFDELVAAVGPWAFDFLQLDRGLSPSELIQIAEPSLRMQEKQSHCFSMRVEARVGYAPGD